MKAHELFAAISPTLATEILEYTFANDKPLYRATLDAVAQARKVRTVFMERQPRAERHATMGAVLARPSLEVAADGLLRNWLLKSHTSLLADFLDALFDQLDGSGVIVGFKRLQSLGAGEDHQQLRLELLEGPGQLLGLGVFRHKCKDLEVAFRVANDTDVIAQLEQGDIAMMVLERFKLQSRAVVGLQLELRFAATVRGEVAKRMYSIARSRFAIPDACARARSYSLPH